MKVRYPVEEIPLHLPPFPNIVLVSDFFLNAGAGFFGLVEIVLGIPGRRKLLIEPNRYMDPVAAENILELHLSHTFAKVRQICHQKFSEQLIARCPFEGSGLLLHFLQRSLSFLRSLPEKMKE